MVFTCIICYELLSPDRENKITRCGHLFHSDCILQWLNRRRTCPSCRGIILVNNLIHVYPTFIEENEAHLNINCPAYTLVDDLNNLSLENQNLKDELLEMRQQNNELNDNLQLKQSSFESLELNMEYLTLEKQDLNLKLTSMDDYTKILLDKNAELKFNLGSSFIQNDKLCNKIKKYEEELKLIKENLILLNSELNKKEKELSTANGKIESLECIKESLFLQNINYRRQNSLNKCDICKELILQIDQSINRSNYNLEPEQSSTVKESDSSKAEDVTPNELRRDYYEERAILGESSQSELRLMLPLLTSTEDLLQMEK